MAREDKTEGPSLLERIPLPYAKILLLAAAFGGAALAIVMAGLTIPIPGTGVVTDPGRSSQPPARA